MYELRKAAISEKDNLQNHYKTYAIPGERSCNLRGLRGTEFVLKQNQITHQTEDLHLYWC